MERFPRWKKRTVAIILAVFFVAGCATMNELKESKPIIPFKDYEKMLLGRLDADYIGTDTCLKACHAHDKIRRDFDLSTMGAQLSSESGMPVVNCESCHGPGSLAIEGITPEKVKADAAAGIRTKCDTSTFIPIKDLPPIAQSLICLKCHSTNATMNLHNWNASTHAVANITCSECHPIHAGHNLKVRPRNLSELCYKCHVDVQASFALPSHHPVPEKRIFCNECHDTHGGNEAKNLRRATVKDTCTQCHAEKAGPFVYEHADLSENCSTCHAPHGSVNKSLLTLREPYLCLQCHPTHRVSGTTTTETKQAFYTRCSDCHSQVHGTDIPSPSGTGRFIQ